MSFLEIFQSFGMNVWLYGGAFILILSILVFVHEWGHYIVARLCGVRVEVFSIGFGKELFGFTDKNNTRWKFSLVPLGGYVKLFGDVDPASVKHSDTVEDPQTGRERHLSDQELQVAFFNKPVWKRALVVAAGPAINYVFAIILLAGLFAFNGQPVTPPSGAAVVVGSSADQNGFQPHDTVISIDGKSIWSFEDIRREMMIALDQEKHFVVEREGEKVDIYAKPEKIVQEDRFGFTHSRGMLGLISPRQAVPVDKIAEIDGQAIETPEAARAALLARMGQSFEIELKREDAEAERLIIHPTRDRNVAFLSGQGDEANILMLSNVDANIFVQYGPFTAIREAIDESWVVTRSTLEAIGQMVTGTRSAKELGGVIRIGALAGDMAKQGVIALVLFTALLSINLGLINLFPIPLLDGGHLVFYAVEALIGRPIPDQIQEYAFRFGLVFLVGIMVFANLNDLMQLIL